ncbi:MAG: DALR domain-containing protein, partial [Bacteroidota bacterium]
AEKGYNRLMEAVESLDNITPSLTSTLDIEAWKQQCYDAMNDDFNSPILIAHLFEGVKYINLLKDNKEGLTAADIDKLGKTIKAFVFDVLGLKNESVNESGNEKLEGVVNMLITMRNEARANKDFALSDQIRNKLIALGIELKDGKEGTTFTVS